jgi:hypothetical protein
VVSKVKKVWKLSAIPGVLVPLLDVELVGTKFGFGAETGGVVTVASAMANSSDPDVDAAV